METQKHKIPKDNPLCRAKDATDLRREREKRGLGCGF
jgi:hypothetical protein